MGFARASVGISFVGSGIDIFMILASAVIGLFVVILLIEFEKKGKPQKKKLEEDPIEDEYVYDQGDQLYF
jgi:hypothetical protein